MVLPGSPKLKNQKGQALLIVLLLMAVSLTVVLSVVSRSVTEVSVSTVEEDALRAFSAAEAGVEDALLSGVSSLTETTQQSLDSSIPDISQAGSYQRSVYAGASPGDTYTYPRDLYSGEAATFWLVSQDANGKLTCNGVPCFTGAQYELCWGNGTTVTPAVEVAAYFDDSGHPSGTDALAIQDPNDLSNIKVARATFDPVNPRTAVNGFNWLHPNKCDIPGVNLPNGTGKTNLPSTSCPVANIPCNIALSVRLLYNETEPIPLVLRMHTSGGSAALPGQGIVIESTGRAGESTRKVNVFRSYAEIPSMFSASVFSKKDLKR